MFKDREHAATLLARRLNFLKKEKGKDIVVVGILRGGFILAYKIAKLLSLPLSFIISRKVGSPYQPELAVGAYCQGSVFLDWEMIDRLGLEKGLLEKILEKAKREAKKKESLFSSFSKIDLRGKRVVLVDDGVATGATVKACIQAIRKIKVKEIILAVPVIAYDTLKDLEKMVDKVIFVEKPRFFSAVGDFYENFSQVSDEEVLKLLHEAYRWSWQSR